MTWWRTISRGGECGSCHELVRAGQEIAFQYASREVRCLICAGAEGLEMQDSKRLRDARRQASSPRVANVRVVADMPRDYSREVIAQLDAAGSRGLRFREIECPDGSALMSTLARLRSEDKVVYLPKVRNGRRSHWVLARHFPLESVLPLHGLRIP